MVECWILVTFAAVFAAVNCQTAGNAVVLTECYNNTALPGITTADLRPPANLNILLEYITKLEDANPSLSPRELSVLIIRALRQDGTARTPRTVDERFAIPYAASRVERHKYRSLVTALLPTISQTLNYGDLTDVEKCSLHYMISNTIDDIRRENEASECSKAARYTARITRRRRDVGEDEGEGEDTEMVMQDPALGTLSAVVAGNSSSCPIELGVIQTQSGVIKVGHVLAGIAAGLNEQSVSNGNGAIYDNRYAATIAGELCETTLSQATTPIVLGNSGGWNSTINPKYFFLQSHSPLRTTDAEIRGALDGLYIALKLNSLTSAYSDLRISQLLDMYYSPYEKGLLEGDFKACNRNIIDTEMTTNDTMVTELVAYMHVLSNYGIGKVSVLVSAYPELSVAAVSSLQTYLPSLATSDLACLGAQSIERVVTDLHIFIDSSWPFTTVQPVLSYVLNHIDVNKYQSRFTLYGGNTLRNLTTNGTKYLSDFYLQYNETIHEYETTGFNYIGIYELVENYGYSKLNNNSYAGGESTIVLLVTRTGLTDEQNTFLTQRREVFKTLLPDISFLVLGSGSASDYSSIVTNTNRDVVTLQESTSEETLIAAGQSVVNSIKQVPRALVNPACTSQYTGSASTFFITDYVEPLGTNYYRISSNYFYSGGDTKNLRIREQGYGTINVCLSRDNARPDNSTGNDCRTLSSSDSVIDITNYCDGTTVSGCQPIYISVSGGNSSANCKSTLCRFPNDIQYTVTMENVGCASGSIVITASALLVLLLCALSRLS